MSAAQISALQNVRQKAGWKCFRARPYARVNFNKFLKTKSRETKWQLYRLNS